MPEHHTPSQQSVTVDARDLKYALNSMALTGCMCAEGGEGECICDYSQREDRQVLNRLWDALPAELKHV